MRPEATLDVVTPRTQPIMERLWQLYRHDFSEFRGTVLEPDGSFPIGRLPTFFGGDPDRRAYLLTCEDHPAGFACVRGLTEERRVVGEFFVVRAWRRRGLGLETALAMFEKHPGRWEIPFQPNNTGAVRFWRHVATVVAGDTWREELRPIPGKPDLPPDSWITLDVARSARGYSRPKPVSRC